MVKMAKFYNCTPLSQVCLDLYIGSLMIIYLRFGDGSRSVILEISHPESFLDSQINFRHTICKLEARKSLAWNFTMSPIWKVLIMMSAVQATTHQGGGNWLWNDLVSNSLLQLNLH